MLVTLPVEIIFLTILHALGWLKLPFIFIAFVTLFFCCAVSLFFVVFAAPINFIPLF